MSSVTIDMMMMMIVVMLRPRPYNVGCHSHLMLSSQMVVVLDELAHQLLALCKLC